MKIEQIRKIVIKKFPVYANPGLKDAAGTWKDIDNFEPELRKDFEKYLTRGVFPSREIEGWTIEKLIKNYGMTPVGAFLTFDWLIREPKRAAEALKKGYDEIIAGRYGVEQWQNLARDNYRLIRYEFDKAFEDLKEAEVIYPKLVIAYEFFRLIRGELFDDLRPLGLEGHQKEIYRMENILAEQLKVLKSMINIKNQRTKAHIKEITHWFK